MIIHSILLIYLFLQMNESGKNRYDIDTKSNRFMEFVSREMMRSKRNRSYAEQPKSRNNVSTH